jgi:hypothetical protein
MKGLLEVALEGTVAGAQCSTSGGCSVIATLVRHTFCVGRAQKVMQQMLESLIEECGRLAGMVASSARLP